MRSYQETSVGFGITSAGSSVFDGLELQIQFVCGSAYTLFVVFMEGQVNLTQRSVLLVVVVTLGVTCLPHLGASQQTETIEPGRLEAGPIRHAELPPELLKRATALEPVFVDVYPITHEKWIEGFRRDAHPEREIAIWEHIATAYRQFTKDRVVPIAQRQEAFNLLLYRSGAPAEETLKHVQLKYLTREEARTLVDLYKAPPEPIRVEKR